MFWVCVEQNYAACSMRLQKFIPGFSDELFRISDRRCALLVLSADNTFGRTAPCFVHKSLRSPVKSSATLVLWT